MASKKKTAQNKRFLMLPRLKTGHGIQVPEGNHWTPRPEALATISRNIDVHNSGERGHSIPDIFSQSIQFEFDLSVGNGDALGQWQGLLATLLLSGDSGLVRVRDLVLSDLAPSPFVTIFRQVAAQRGIEGITLFELRRPDGSYGAVAFRYEGMPTMLCPAADIQGPFLCEDPWIIPNSRGLRFAAPQALLKDTPRRLALRNEIYALSSRSIPVAEHRDGLQLQVLRDFLKWLNQGEDGISDHPVSSEIRSRLYTLDPTDQGQASEIFTDKLCLFRIGEAYNRLDACMEQTMNISHGNQPTPWHALLPLRQSFAQDKLAALRAGRIQIRLRWHNGAVDAELLDESKRTMAAKRYRIQDLLNQAQHRNAPQIAVWPPKALLGWNRYYLLRNEDENSLPLDVHAFDLGPAQDSVTLLPRMPEALSFSQEGQELGLLLPAFETLLNNKVKAYNIGFDFGTTATTAYKHDVETGITSPISFTGQGALFLFGRHEGSATALTSQLVSERIANRATHYSLLRRKTQRIQEGHSLLQTTIPFLTSAAFNPEVLQQVSDELKWGMLGADKLRAHLFLEEYLMMCLWHLVSLNASSIHWRASYPLAMHGRLQEDFIAKMQTIIGSLCQNCYRIPYEAHFCSESEAVGFMMMDNDIQARYLEGLTINDETGFFCLDIGGGSTDLSLWLRRKPVMQASLRWAGNAILCDSVTRENHGDLCPPRLNLIESFFTPLAPKSKRDALSTPLVEGRYAEFRRVWNVLADEITDAVKGLHRTNPPLLNYMNILRFNLYQLFYFAGRMLREAIAAGIPLGQPGQPLPVAVLGNGAKMLKMLYNDVELIKQKQPDGSEIFIPQERRNEPLYQEEMDRLQRVFQVGCGSPTLEAVIIEPFMPKQETAHGLALAPEAYLLQRAHLHYSPPLSGRSAHLEDWPSLSAYQLAQEGTVVQAMTSDFRDLVSESFTALRAAIGDDDAFREFLASLFNPPTGADKYNVESYYRTIWAQCLRHNPEPMLPGQPLPHKNTISGRFVEMLGAMNRMMRTGE